MTPPRMRVGIVSEDGPALRVGCAIARALDAAGHSLSEMSDPQDAPLYEALLISVADADLSEVVERLLPFVRAGQVVLHSSVGCGAQALGPLAERGAIVGALCPLDERVWVVDPADEVAAPVLELLVEEFGGRSIAVPESRRPLLALAATWLEFVATVRDEAFDLLNDALDDVELAAAVVQAAGRRVRGLPDTRELERQLRHLMAADEPARARVFRALVLRSAQVDHDHEAELWAIQQGIH